VEHVLALADAGAGPPKTAVDAYSGVGQYARSLVAAGWSITAIELDTAACAAARQASSAGYTLLEGRVEERLAEALPADLLIVNPPRAGLGTDVVRSILDEPPERIVYVSCDPATLARDVAALSSSYEMGSIECFDLFPQTAHVETVLAMSRRTRG
jgi:23S rRNA (uracil1939-C5)-methyltransferase